MEKHSKIIEKFNLTRRHDERLKKLSIKYIPFDELYVDQSQIDSFNEFHLEEILENFHPALLRASSVVLIDGKYYLWDGQHSATACWLNGMDEIPCIVYETDNLDFKRISSVEKFDGRQIVEMFEQVIEENQIDSMNRLYDLFQMIKDSKNE